MGKLTENNKKQTMKTLKDLFESKNAYSVDIKLNEEYTMTVYAKSLTDRDLTESVKTFDKELLEDNINVDVFDSLDLVYHSDYLPLNTLTEKLLSKVCYDLGIKRNEEKLTESAKKPAKKKAVKKDKVRFVGNPEKEISMFNSFMGESYDADAPELQKLFELLPQLKGLTPDQLNVVAEEILSENEEFECGGDLLSCLADYVIDAFESCKGDCPELSDWVDDILDSMDVVLVTDDEEGIDSIPELKDLSREKLVELGLELFGNAVAVDDDDVIDALNELIKNHYDDEETINQVIYLAQELKDKEIAPRTEGEGEEELEEGRKRKYIEVRVLQGNYGSGWDDLCEYEIPEDWEEAKKVYKEIRDDVKAYRENEPQYPHRVVSRKKPINNTSKEEKSNTDENKGLKEEKTELTEDESCKKEDNTIKIKSGKKISIEKPDTSKAGEEGHPIQKGLKGRTGKLEGLKEDIDEDDDDFVVCCEDVSRTLDAGYWHGMTRSERSWGLSVNGSDGDQFSPYFADVITSEISYPVNDGYFEYDGLDVILTKDTVEDIEDETLKRDLLSVGCSEEDIEEFLNGDDNAEIEFFIDYSIDIDDLEDFEECLKKNLKEDTVKQGNAWVNKGKEGTHGKFKTKKEADAQRKAMFARGYTEGLEDKYKIEYQDDFVKDDKGEVRVFSKDEVKDFLDGVDILDKNNYKAVAIKEGMKDRLDAYVKSLDKKKIKESDELKVYEVNFEKKNDNPPFEYMNASRYVKATSEEEAIEKIIKKLGIERDKVNGAYEVELEEDLTESNKLNFDDENVKDIVKDILENEIGGSLSCIAKTAVDYGVADYEDVYETDLWGFDYDPETKIVEIETEDNLLTATIDDNIYKYLDTLQHSSSSTIEDVKKYLTSNNIKYSTRPVEWFTETDIYGPIEKDFNTEEMFGKIVDKIVSDKKAFEKFKEEYSTDLCYKYDYYESLKEAEDEEKKDTTTFYSLEVGVLLPEDDEEYNSYNDVFDKKHGFYDESHEESLDEQVLVNKATEYINAGVPGTYGIITKIEVENFDGIEEKVKEVEENGFIEESVDFFNGEQYDIENVVWCAYKNEDEELVNDFLELEEKPAEEVEVKETEVEEESLEEAAGSMKDKVERSTQNYTKPKGAIQCNKGAQAEEVEKLLRQHYKKVEVVPVGKSSVQVKYLKESLEDKTADELAYERYKNGEYTYDEYVTVCKQEECEPLPELKEAWGDYKAYDKEEGWTDADIELHKNTDWKARNYEVLPTEDEYVGEVHLVGGDRNGIVKDVKFHKVIRSNPIFPPYYKPDENFEGYLGPMFDGDRHNGIDIHNRYETQEVYDALSEAKEEKPEEESSEKETEKWTKTFEEFLDLIEFELVKNGDKWALRDLQGANLGDIESETFENATEIFDRLDVYIGDYFLDAIINIIEDFDGTEDLSSCEDFLNWYNTIGKEKYADELADSAWDFEVLDMIVNHSDEVDLNKVYGEVEESLKEAYRGKDFDDYMRCLKILGYGSSDLERIKNENNFNEQELLNYLRKEAEEKGDK